MKLSDLMGPPQLVGCASLAHLRQGNPAIALRRLSPPLRVIATLRSHERWFSRCLLGRYIPPYGEIAQRLPKW